MLEGWGYSFASHPLHVVYCMLTQSPVDQLQMVQSLKEDATWWALTRASDFAPEVRAILSALGHVLPFSSAAPGQLPTKGAGASRCLQTCKTKENWPLWASSEAAGSAQMGAELKSGLDNMLLTED